MVGYRFYLEYANKKDKNKSTKKDLGSHRGTVIAVLFENKWYDKDIIYEAMGAVQDYPDNPVGSTSCSQGYLSDNCKRIPEKMAREIHPNLFKALD